jgi:DnaK suppressor protein
MNTEPYKQKLLAEKATLEGELGSLGTQDAETKVWQATSPEEGEQTDFREEVADRLEEDNSRAATMEPLRTRLTEVEAALARIEAGTYGVCEKGGETIEESRLEANPAARTCMLHLEDDSD